MSGFGFPFAESPAVLLLTDGSEADQAGVQRLARGLATRGSTVYVAPWHAVRAADGGVLLAGSVLIDGAALPRQLPLWTPVSPQVLIPAASPDLEGLASTYRRIADVCPAAVLTWTPELEGDHARLRTAVQAAVDKAAVDQATVDQSASRPRLAAATVPGAGAARRRRTGLPPERGPATEVDVFVLVVELGSLELLVDVDRAPLAHLPDRRRVAAELKRLAADGVRTFAQQAQLADSAHRHRLLPWITVRFRVEPDVAEGPAPAGSVRVVDADFGCRQPAGPSIGRAVLARCRSTPRVLLPDPDSPVLVSEPGRSEPGRDGDTALPRQDAAQMIPFAATLLPRIGAAPCLVDTIAWPGARFVWRDDRLRVAGGRSPAEVLGRVIGSGPGPVERRYVEPGVGRTCLVDGVGVAGRPEFHDASVLGIGLTPYSAHGYAMIGPHVDGLTSMLRAEMRRNSAERLAAAGCRTALTLALIELPGLDTTMPDYSSEPAALVVRAFRSVLRVKQLDPLATPYLSPQHRPLLLSFLADRRWETDPARATLGWEPGRLGGTVRSQRQIADAHGDPHVSPEAARRREVIALYAPLLVRFARARLALELGRDPVAEPPTVGDYIGWFAERLGAQLALMRRERFLHDYHQPEIGRPDPNLAYSLGESNVSLLAEFVDLDTGVFCADPDELTCEAFRLRRADAARLRDEYPRWHAHDRAEARSVVRTLSSLASHGQRRIVDQALRTFDESYERS